MRLLISILAAAALVPATALAGQVTLVNATAGPIEVREVRAGTVKIAAGGSASFLYPAEHGDFRVWMAENKCTYVFLFDASDDASLQLAEGPALYKLPAGAQKAVDLPALKGAQPVDWPLLPPDLICD